MALNNAESSPSSSIKSHGRIVFELEDLDNFVEQFSEKRGVLPQNKM